MSHKVVTLPMSSFGASAIGHNFYMKLFLPEKKLQILDRVLDKSEFIADVCRQEGISRKTFYKWLHRYKSGSEDAGLKDKLNLLRDRYPNGDSHYKYIPDTRRKELLRVVKEHPELGVHALSRLMGVRDDGSKLISHNTVHRILKEQDLHTYEKRIEASRRAETTDLSTLPRPSFSYLEQKPFQSELAPLQPHGPPSFIDKMLRVFAVLNVFLFSLIFLFYITHQSFVDQRYDVGRFFGLTFASIALLFGFFFFLYSLKYYLVIASVLGYREKERPDLYINSTNMDQRISGRGIGLLSRVDDVQLERYPFVSIHVATYNEKRVVNRLLTACTNQDYPFYEVIVADDSTDETVDILEGWKDHPRVKVSHRSTRAGFKGGALSYALEKTDPRSEFVIVFDADFIPYPDTITQFLKYYQFVTGSSYHSNKIAAIQGYQWHVLNKSENWITRGVRSEYAGSYVVERSGTEIFGALKQIAGSVYLIRRDVLEKFGWGTSITEDFELTLRLYEQGYKVVYTPYIQTPSECVATVRQLIRQRMRWAEGHSFNIKRMFFRLLETPGMTSTEKIEFVYLAPYYLQSFFFLIGTLSWFFSEVIFHARLPFWTSLWGWSLVFSNLLSLPLMNSVGLFLEESEEKDFLGIFSFVVLSYLLVPFQAYASIKGLLEEKEGPWFRTPKTGRITDLIKRGSIGGFSAVRSFPPRILR